MGLKDFALGLGKHLYRTPKTALDQSVSDYTNSEEEPDVIIENENVETDDEQEKAVTKEPTIDTTDSVFKLAYESNKQDNRWKVNNGGGSSNNLLPTSFPIAKTDTSVADDLPSMPMEILDSDTPIIKLISEEIINNDVVMTKLVNMTAGYLVQEYTEFHKLTEEQQSLLDKISMVELNPDVIAKLTEIIKDDVKSYIKEFMDKNNV